MEREASEEGQVRPKTIVYFERFIFGILLLGVLEIYLARDKVDQAIARAAAVGQNSPVVAILSMIIFTFVLIGTLTLLVSRRRSKIAMWVLIVWYVLALYFYVVDSITVGRLGSDFIMSVLQQIAQIAAFGLLFTPSARRWMNREDEKAA